jgi:CRISPR/Cas system Type II protein with McrA/HNH and RuvC-like nuclease domain
MNLEEYYMTNLYCNNNKIQKDKNFEYNSQENYEKFGSNDNLYEKMETTLNTFMKNLKKDDFSNFSSTNNMENIAVFAWPNQLTFSNPRQVSMSFNTPPFVWKKKYIM